MKTKRLKLGQRVWVKWGPLGKDRLVYGPLRIMVMEQRYCGVHNSRVVKLVEEMEMWQWFSDTDDCVSFNECYVYATKPHGKKAPCYCALFYHQVCDICQAKGDGKDVEVKS